MRIRTTLSRSFFQTRASRRNVQMVVRLVVSLLILLAFYSVIFLWLMHYEGRSYSVWTSFYWVATNMSTLGPGDVVFESDLGRMFSVLVNLSGIVYLLIPLPVVFYQFFQSSARAPRELAPDVRDHVIITHYDTLTHNLIEKLDQYNSPYVLVIPELSEALNLFDQGFNVVVGDLDVQETWENVHAEHAAMVVSTNGDSQNASIALNLRGVSPGVPLVATAEAASAVEILLMAGSSQVFHLAEMMGQSLSRRTNAGDRITHVIGTFDQLLIAEATASNTPLIGKTIQESKLREIVGVTVIGVWERGRFSVPNPETRITHNTVLVLAGTKEQLGLYDEYFCIYYATGAPVLILGGGNVGQATARALDQRDLDYRMVERLPDRSRDSEKTITGDATHLDVLEKAGIRDAAAVVITPHNDELNIFLTLYCRHLRPDIQIICRATRERSVHTMHNAGADFVISYASMGATSILNFLKRNDVLMVTEGLDVFRVKLPSSLVNKLLSDSSIRSRTDCSVVAINDGHEMIINPDPKTRLDEGTELILIGTEEAERKFFELFM